MPTLTVGQYVLQLFLAEHAAHTQTKVRAPSGNVHIECSCGVTLSVPVSDS